MALLAEIRKVAFCHPHTRTMGRIRFSHLAARHEYRHQHNGALRQIAGQVWREYGLALSPLLVVRQPQTGLGAVNAV